MIKMIKKWLYNRRLKKIQLSDDQRKLLQKSYREAFPIPEPRIIPLIFSPTSVYAIEPYVGASNPSIRRKAKKEMQKLIDNTNKHLIKIEEKDATNCTMDVKQSGDE